MKQLFLLLAFAFSFSIATAQNPSSDSLINNSNEEGDSSLLLMDEQPQQALLPERMMLTQRLIYGEKGVLRISNLIPLTLENREKEMKVRRGMLFTHQLVGYLTLASILGTATTGIFLYNGYPVKDLHEGFASATNAGYIAGACLAFLAPPPLVYRGKGKWDSIDFHKMFACMHLTGMITTNILSEFAGQGGAWKKAHGIAGGFTALTFTAAFVSIKF
ncbi:MAG: hypothetical protein NT150_02375 [Bacteroidetes bacterium]|nr:hypothetical protein [Bacteroidota bacterium]